MSLSPSPCCHPGGFQHSLPCPLLTGSAGPAGGGTRSGPGSPLQSKAEGQGGQEGSAVLGCPGSASWHALGTTGAPAQLRATCRGSAPTQAGTRPWVLLPTPARGRGCEGLCSPSMMPHLVLRPSTRLPFTWCSWSAPTTAKGIFSCRHRGSARPRCCSPRVPRVLVPCPAPQGPASSIPASRHSHESCRSVPCLRGPGQSPPAGTH